MRPPRIAVLQTSFSPPKISRTKKTVEASTVYDGAKTDPRRKNGGAVCSSLSFCLRDWREFPLCTFGTRGRASPESHPRTVLVPTGTPESVTPSAGRRPFSWALRLSCSIVNLTIPQTLQTVNPWRTFMCMWWIFEGGIERNWRFCEGKFTICSFFRRRLVVY